MVVHRPDFLSALKAALVLALIAWQPAGWTQSQATAEVAISVDKNPIAANDTFILTLTVNQLVNDSAWRPQDVLDDLQVLGSSSSRSTQIINGETSEQTTFNTIIRAPDTAGDYTIGPVELLGATSNSIVLEVLAAADSEQLLDQRKAFMRVELNRSQAYVQEQVQLTAKLYLAANLHSGNIIPQNLKTLIFARSDGIAKPLK
ncbi:BatD family protein [Pseudidiomarina halophila]|uniref:BatD family protein n=1 Tax=Pseudidiomarina halophila TaxID=1449799 RepID=UPI00361FA6A1